jgi:limonene-1,2-epoxide hydrolase
MNDLAAFFAKHDGRMIHKWHHFFDIYDRHFARHRGRPVKMLELGISQGGSIQMWRDYFGPDLELYGVDINPDCKRFEEPGVRIFIGDQEDRSFLRSVAAQVPDVDILIDDGGHTMRQQIHTFEELFDKVIPTGTYLIEDLHTSYWRHFGGGVRRRGTFIEYSKDFIDRIHAWHSKQVGFEVTDFTRSVHSLHYYDSVLVIEKRPMQTPTHERRGSPSFPDYITPPIPIVSRLAHWVRQKRAGR